MPGAGQIHAARQSTAAPVPSYSRDLSPRQATPDAPFRGIDRRSGRDGVARAGRTPWPGVNPGSPVSSARTARSRGVRRAHATARPAGGVIDHEGRSALKKLLLAASLALTGLLATAAATLAAATPALAATSAPNFGYYDNQPIEYEATV